MARPIELSVTFEKPPITITALVSNNFDIADTQSLKFFLSAYENKREGRLKRRFVAQKS